jgi:hypothetical protein
VNLLYFFAAIGALSTIFVPSAKDAAPSLIISGTTLPSAVVHVIIDTVDTYEQVDDSGHFNIQAWQLGPGQHDVLVSAANSQGKSVQKEFVVTLAEGVVTINLSDINLGIVRPALSSAVSRFDLNKDGKFDFKDINLFLSEYKKKDSRLDFNYDSKVNLTDLSIMVSYYLSIIQ